LISDDGSNSIWRVFYTGTGSQSERAQDNASHNTKGASK
jgi:hypothetical protein